MKIYFLGTNGWYDTAVGSTPCFLIDTKDKYIILDAGFGLHKVAGLLKEDKPVYLFLSHFHMDHICGLHVLPLLNKKIKHLTIIGRKGLKKMLDTVARHPYEFNYSKMDFKIDLKEIKSGKYTLPFDFVCKELVHIDGCLGYRFELEGKTIVYCTDTKICENDFLLAQGADVLLHECAYRVKVPDDFWGHTSPEEAGELAKKANVKKMFLVHFGTNAFPTRPSRLVAQNRARQKFKNTFAAFDGDKIVL